MFESQGETSIVEHTTIIKLKFHLTLTTKPSYKILPLICKVRVYKQLDHWIVSINGCRL